MKTSGRAWLWIVALIVVVAAALWWLRSRPPSVSFMPYGAPYQTKPDFATLERKYPLTPAMLSALTPQNLKSFDQEQIEQIFARLTSGPFPNGSYQVSVFFPKGASGKPRLAEIIGGLKGATFAGEMSMLTLLTDVVWREKVFDREQGIARTRVLGGALLTKFLNQFFPGRSEAKDLGAAPPGESRTLFPAKVYCGQSLIDSRRESIIVDYNFAEDIPGFRQIPDSLLGRGDCAQETEGEGCIGGLFLRDEIRRIRPGFYLGRVYAADVFVANFTLLGEPADGAEVCWIGDQRAAAGSKP